MAPQRSQRSQKVINKWAARVVPGVIVGIIAYVSWVFIGEICVHYLLRPRESNIINRREGAAAALIAVYAILLSCMIIYYIRVLQVVTVNPGYVALGTAPGIGDGSSFVEGREKPVSQGSSNTAASPEGTQSHNEENDTRARVESKDIGLDRRAMFKGHIPVPPGIEKFYNRPVFVSDFRGLPIFCAYCNNFKPDRTHHCSEVERCVRRMDHFCPWVGGIVSESNTKFFIQFTISAAVFTAYVLVVDAYFFAERRRKLHNIDGNWLALIALAALFFLFSFGLAASTIQLSLSNLTTVENLDKGNKTYHLAVLMDRSLEPGTNTTEGSSTGYQPSLPFNVITYSKNPGLPPLLDPPLRPQEFLPPGTSPADPNTEQGFNLPSTSPDAAAADYSDGRRFAVLQTVPGDNPWDLGPFRNWQSLMGYSLLDWVLPIKYSPLYYHSPEESEFPMGPVLDRLKRDAGISSSLELEQHKQHRRRKSHRSRRHGHPDNQTEPSAQELDELAEETHRKKKRRRNSKSNPVKHEQA